MKKMIVDGLITLLLVCGLPAISGAEPQDFDRPSEREQPANVRQRVEAMRMWRLTKALDLDEKTSARLFPLLNKYDKRRFESERALREGIRELREALRDKREERLKALLAKLEKGHEEIMRTNDAERADLKKVLTLEQQARFILFQQEFDMEMRRMIEEAREKRRDRAPGQGPFGPPPPGPER